MDNANKDKKPTTKYDLDLALRHIALLNVSKDVVDLETLIDHLRRWWCRYYRRPYKDPLLDCYTLEELLLEYHEINFMDNPKEKETAWSELQENLYGDEDEEWLKRVMGDQYVSPEEMAQSQISTSKKK